MECRFPRFVPILTAYATRVSGRSLPELLASPAALARALADTQRIVGHDGVLCFYEPHQLVLSCLCDGKTLCAPEDFPRTGVMAVILEAAQALEQQLSLGVQRVACIPGPSLMRTELERHANPKAEELADYDYVSDAFLAAVRAACESGVSGVAVLEDLREDSAEEISHLYGSARKLIDFYSRAFLLFLQPGSSTGDSIPAADRVFVLPSEKQEIALLKSANAGESAAFSTSCDVPPDTPVETLRELCAHAMRD